MDPGAMKTATAVSYAASTGAVIFGLSASEFAAVSGAVAAIVGALLAVATFAVNLYFRQKHYRLHHQQVTACLRDECPRTIEGHECPRHPEQHQRRAP